MISRQTASGCGRANGGSQQFPQTVRGAGTGRLGLRLVRPVPLWSQVADGSVAYRDSEHVCPGRWRSQRSATSASVESRYSPYSRSSWPRLEGSTAMEARSPKLRLLLQPLKFRHRRHRLRPFGPRQLLANQRFHRRSHRRSLHQSLHRFPNHHQSRALVVRRRIRGVTTSAAGNISTAQRQPFALTSTALPASGPAPTGMSTSALMERTATPAAGRAPARITVVSAVLYIGHRTAES